MFKIFQKMRECQPHQRSVTKVATKPLYIKFAVVGCIGSLILTLPSCENHASSAGSIVSVNHMAADYLAKELRLKHLVPDQGDAAILVTTLVNIDNLKQTSTFGRLSADELGAGLAQRGIRIAETRMGNAFQIRPNGGFVLSPEVRDFAVQQKADAVLVGTYADAGADLLVSVRLIRLSDDVIIGAFDYSVGIDPVTHQKLLPDGAR
jgi:TolB-like protein